MLDKIKDLSAQVATKAGDAVDGITLTVKEGVGSLASSAGTMTGALNEKAVRASTAQMCRILEIAMQELDNRPMSNRRVTLTATVNIGIAALEMQIHRDPPPSDAEPAAVTLPTVA
ncbi:MAG: hypothetical protein ABW106_01600 [Steroidobacteraceae bacterium]